eukprot:5408037-Amphidinium_carterae.2
MSAFIAAVGCLEIEDLALRGLAPDGSHQSEMLLSPLCAFWSNGWQTTVDMVWNRCMAKRQHRWSLACRYIYFLCILSLACEQLLSDSQFACIWVQPSHDTLQAAVASAGMVRAMSTTYQVVDGAAVRENV